MQIFFKKKYMQIFGGLQPEFHGLICRDLCILRRHVASLYNTFMNEDEIWIEWK